MLRRRAIAIITILALVGSAELIRLAASPTPGQTPRHSPAEILGLRLQPQQLPGRADHDKRSRIGKKSRLFGQSSVDVSSIFLQAPTFQTGGPFPQAMVGADVNRDGIPDMLVAHYDVNGNGSVVVLMGKGDGTFQSTGTFASGGYVPDSLAVADVNGDGNLDVVVANTCAGGSGGVCAGNGVVGILLGNGDGTFQSAQVLQTAAYYATSVAVADLNGDGNPDIVVTDECASTDNCVGVVAVFLGSGGGNFQPPQYCLTGGYAAVSVAVADIDGDGKPDVVIANRGVDINNNSGLVSVLRGNGDGTLQNAQTYNSGGVFAGNVTVADVNKDGHPDVVVLNQCTTNAGCNDASDSSVGILLGNGNGTFQTAQVYDSGGILPVAMTIADVNGDSYPDLIVANRYQAGGDGSVNSSVAVLLGNGDGTFHTAHTYNSMGNTAQSVAVADVNGDGKPDVLVSNWTLSSLDGSSDAVAVMLGRGDGSFHAAPTYSPGGALQNNSAAMADLNGDGKTDLVVTSECLTLLNCVGSVDVLLGNGDGTFQTPQTYASGGMFIQAVTIADVNRDGQIDLIVANQCLGNSDCSNTAANGSVGVLLGNADGSFQPVQTYDSGGRFANSVAVADVNGDGIRDLVVGNQCMSSADCSSGAVTVLLGKSDGTFQDAQAFSSGGYSANSVLAADVNGDGVPDVLVADSCLDETCTNNGQVAVLFGNGDGTLQAAQTYDSGSTTAHSILLADVNGDGKLDVVVANVDSVGILLGNGDGTFQPALISAAAYGYQGQIVASDFNGDGKLDIASSDGSLLLGNGDGTFAATTGLIPPGPGIAVGDLNGDGKADLAIGGVTVLLNIAGQTFPTTTALTSSLNPSEFGQDVTFTATVASADQGNPSGTVVFNDGATVLGTAPLSNRTAALTVSNLSAGTHPIGAFYSGDAKFSASTSPVLDQVVHPPAIINVTETIHVTDSPIVLPSALVAVNESIHVTDKPAIAKQKVAPTISWPTPAPITYGTPLSGTQLDASANVPGTFVYTPAAGTILGAGSQTLSVLFTPTDVDDYSTAMASVVLVVNQASTAVLLTSSANPQAVGKAVTFTATTSSPAGGSMTGPVVFYANGTTLGSVPLAGNAASLTTSFATNGNYNITASYSGDGNYLGSTSATLNEIIGSKFKTTLGLDSSLNPSYVGQAVTFTATFGSVRPPDGESITFKRGTVFLGTGVIVQGAASFATSSLPVGTGKISAHYLGDGVFGASSAAIPQTVNRYPTTTTLVSNLNPAAHGQLVTFTATVTSAGPAPTGKVRFEDGAIILGTVTLSDGVATFTTKKLAVGTHPITARYLGDSANATSTSSVFDQVVQ